MLMLFDWKLTLVSVESMLRPVIWHFCNFLQPHNSIAADAAEAAWQLRFQMALRPLSGRIEKTARRFT
jgi:hypothetical protein